MQWKTLLSNIKQGFQSEPGSKWNAVMSMTCHLCNFSHPRSRMSDHGCRISDLGCAVVQILHFCRLSRHWAGVVWESWEEKACKALRCVNFLRVPSFFFFQCHGSIMLSYVSCSNVPSQVAASPSISSFWEGWHTASASKISWTPQKGTFPHCYCCHRPSNSL